MAKAIKNKYLAGKVLIQNGAIKDLDTLLQFVPKTNIAKDLHMHHDTLKSRIEDPGTFILKEVVAIAKLLDIKPIEFLQLIMQVDEEKKPLH